MWIHCILTGSVPNDTTQRHRMHGLASIFSIRQAIIEEDSRRWNVKCYQRFSLFFFINSTLKFLLLFFSCHCLKNNKFTASIMFEQSVRDKEVWKRSHRFSFMLWIELIESIAISRSDFMGKQLWSIVKAHVWLLLSKRRNRFYRPRESAKLLLNASFCSRFRSRSTTTFWQ